MRKFWLSLAHAAIVVGGAYLSKRYGLPEISAAAGGLNAIIPSPMTGAPGSACPVPVPEQSKSAVSGG